MPKSRLLASGYVNFEEFLLQNSAFPHHVKTHCGVSSETLRRYKNGTGEPCHSCIKLIELVCKGKIPYPGWEEMRFNEFGLVVPGQKYELNTEQLKSYWHKHQHHHWLERKIRILESKLLKLEEERAKRLEVVVRMDNQDVHHWRLTG